jgi:hypothetical protein
MNFFLQNKMLSIGAAVVLLAGGYYFFFSGGSSADPALSTGGANPAVSQQLLATLASLHTIQLDNSIFSSPVFMSLNDFGVSIPPQNVGRRNPFDPLGATGGATTIINTTTAGQPAAGLPATAQPATTKPASLPFTH